MSLRGNRAFRRLRAEGDYGRRQNMADIIMSELRARETAKKVAEAQAKKAGRK